MTETLTHAELQAAIADEGGEVVLAAVEHPEPSEDAMIARIETREALAEMLLDLGFLTEGVAAELDLEAEGVPADLLSAVAAFVAEDPIASVWANTLAKIETEVPEVVLNRIEDLVGFDGSLTFDAREYISGHRSTMTRALHHHLRAFGLTAPSPEEPVDHRTSLALVRFAFSIGVKRVPVAAGASPLSGDDARLLETLVARLGDIAQVMEGYLASNAPRPVIVLSDEPDAGREDPILFVKAQGATYTMRTQRDVRRRRSSLGPEQSESLALALQGWAGPAVLHSDAGNAFGVSVLQLLLWMRGFYRGRVDGLWGLEAHRALIEAIDFEGADREALVVPLRGGYKALDAGAISGFLLAIATGDNFAGEFTHVAADARNFERAAQLVEPKKSLWSHVWGGIKKPFKVAIEGGRKVYRAFRRVLTVGVKALLMGFSWLGDQLANLVGPARMLVRALGRVASALSTFGYGLRFILDFIRREPAGTRSDSGETIVLTHFDFDADAVVGVLGRPEEAVIRRHMRKIRAAARWSGLLMSIAIKGVKALLALSGPVGWLRFAVALGGAVKEVVGNWQELGPAFEQ